ncbi:hypothetical protein [Labrys monachus]|uniref:Uncharacterized protein n=1 Tax=Labrys monachus TaxID=217067 RepID=A0ABU0FCY0_9HYPH|nr:hypothetical protein [Labrys monachus]MDQ0392455.1 hypothetical protein [Labrys monachus]
MESRLDEISPFQSDRTSVTIDRDTGAITIDVVADGFVRIVLTADGDIEFDGRSLLNTIQWTDFSDDIVTRG